MFKYCYTVLLNIFDIFTSFCINVLYILVLNLFLCFLSTSIFILLIMGFYSRKVQNICICRLDLFFIFIISIAILVFKLLNNLRYKQQFDDPLYIN